MRTPSPMRRTASGRAGAAPPDCALARSRKRNADLYGCDMFLVNRLIRAPLRCMSAVFLLVSAPLVAQWQSAVGPEGAALGAPIGSDMERYLRALSISGAIRPVIWGARDLSVEDVVGILASESASHPWQARLRRSLDRRLALGASAMSSYNTGFPWGQNDGPVWQGRGATGALGGAATLRIGPLGLTAAPLVFAAQNAEFPLMPTSGFDSVQTGIYAYDIDLPQRFGVRRYARGNAGESSLRLTLSGIALGVSTEAEGWGVGEAFPSILGANAGGFPHVYVGTHSRGVRIPSIGRFGVRYLVGVMSQSAWSPVTGADTFASIEFPGRRRATVGVVGSWMPAFASNLEVGVSRFYHSPWRGDKRTWNAWSKPFEGVLKAGFGDRGEVSFDPTGDLDNQLASLYSRWAFPSRGAELAFEYFREDHNYDNRDLAGEPEQNGATSASLRVLTDRSASKLSMLTLEYFSGDVRPIAQQRAQGLLYFHGTLRQGHTERGQLLGSPIGAGAVDGQRASWERFQPAGSVRVMLQRLRTRSRPSTDPERLFREVNRNFGMAHDWVIDGSLALSRLTRFGNLGAEFGLAYSGVFQLEESRTNLYLRLSAARF